MILTKITEKEKEHKEDTVFTKTGDDDVELIEEGMGVPHVTHVNNILHSIFLMPNCTTLTTTKSTIRKDIMLTNLTFLAISEIHLQNTRDSGIVKGMTKRRIQRISSKIKFLIEE